MNLPCKFFLSGCLCCLMPMEVQAQDGQSQSGQDTVFCFALGGAT